MNIKIKKLSGNAYTALDTISVMLDSSGDGFVNSAVYTIEVVSGEGVSHGGGAESGEYLNYSTDGVFNELPINVVQLSKGESVIKVLAKIEECASQADADLYVTLGETFGEALDAYNEGGKEGDAPIPPETPFQMIKAESVETTISWGDDTYK